MDASIILPILAGLALVVIVGFVGLAMFLQIALWVRDNKSPVQTEEASVVAKRSDVRKNTLSNVGNVYTDYYATFERPSGARFEFAVDAREYGLLAEGDRGLLTFQGTRYKKFHRHRAVAPMRVRI